MKKTLSVNIAGIAFSIDEDAYQMLKTYLEDIEYRLNSQNDDSETMKDIEIRIAEIISEHGIDPNMVINISLVKSIISIIGNPSVFGEAIGRESATAEESTQKKYEYSYIAKRLLRDPNNKAIAGVCSGLAAYFGLDVALVRAVFVIFLIFGGMAFWVYLILWIVVPVAKTKEEIEMLERLKRNR